jgi:hypothetical protein
MEVLRRNAAGARNIVPLLGAVWDTDTELRISNPTAGAAAFRVEEGEGDLRAYSIPGIAASADDNQLFLVKVDIEGGEAAVFRSNTAWVSDAAAVIIELHDWLYPAEGTSRAFLRSAARVGGDFLVRGENVFCFPCSGAKLEEHQAATDAEEQP